jgi:phosphoglycerate dehydrogenase-like enzyme
VHLQTAFIPIRCQLTASNCDPDLINASAKLRWIQTLAAGVEDCVGIPKVRDGGIVLTNMQRVNGPNISEHAMALILTLTRQINAYLVNQSEGKWDQRPPQQLMDLDGHTMLVVGLGGIGTMIAERAHAFGMHVIATRDSGHEGPNFVDYVGVADELPSLIGQADIVVNVTPLTSKTIGLRQKRCDRSSPSRLECRPHCRCRIRRGRPGALTQKSSAVACPQCRHYAPCGR